jgi:hypothetical protein
MNCIFDASETMWCNYLIASVPRIWLDLGSALPFQTRLTQTKPVLPLSNEHGSQVKDQGRWQCCRNKHKTISLSAYTWCIFTFRTRLLWKEVCIHCSSQITLLLSGVIINMLLSELNGSESDAQHSNNCGHFLYTIHNTTVHSIVSLVQHFGKWSSRHHLWCKGKR